MTHCRSSCENPRSVWIDGSATFTTATSSTTMNCTVQRRARASHLRRDEVMLLRTPFRNASTCLRTLRSCFRIASTAFHTKSVRAILRTLMAKRFEQYCPIAHAMSLVGERWALLVVRELLKGPRRYTDLAGGLPGIGTNVLATRLRELEAAGVIARRKLPPPAASTVYELTDYGAQLEEVLHAMARWGARSLGLPRPSDELDPDWGLNAFPALLYPERAREVTSLYVVRIGDDAFTVRLDDGCLHVADGAHGEPDADMAMDFQTFYELEAGDLDAVDAIEEGRLRVDGDRDAAIRFFEMFSAAPRLAPVAGDGDRLRPRVAAAARAWRGAAPRPEQRRLARALEPQVVVCAPGGGAPARCPLQEPTLQEVGLVDVLDRVRLLAHRDRERRQPDRPAGEADAHRVEDLAVGAVEAEAVDLEQLERGVGRRAVDDAGAADLGPVAHALEQPVGDARRAAAALGDRPPAAVVERHAEDRRRAPDDPREVVGAVGLEAVLDAEAVAQRRREQPGPRRRADERERRQVERHDLGARPLPDRDRQPSVLHRRIERLLERAREPVDLVDEEDAARLEGGQERGDVALALERRARRLHEGHVELLGDDLRERRLPEPGRAREQDVVERVAARRCGLDGYGQLLAYPVLADELLERARPQRAGELVLVGEDAGRLDAGRLAHPRPARSALARSSSAVAPSAPSSIACASAGAKPGSSRPSRATTCGSSPRLTEIGASPGSGMPTFSRSSTTMRSAVRLPMPGTACS